MVDSDLWVYEARLRLLDLVSEDLKRRLKRLELEGSDKPDNRRSSPQEGWEGSCLRRG